MYHMWRMMQVGTSNCVPHMAHDAVKVLRELALAEGLVIQDGYSNFQNSKSNFRPQKTLAFPTHLTGL